MCLVCKRRSDINERREEKTHYTLRVPCSVSEDLTEVSISERPEEITYYTQRVLCSVREDLT